MLGEKLGIVFRAGSCWARDDVCVGASNAEAVEPLYRDIACGRDVAGDASFVREVLGEKCLGLVDASSS